jgi:hypothetical protein
MENKVEAVITRDAVESFVGKELTDKEWEVLASEIEDTMTHYVWADLPSMMDNLEYNVEQDAKYD